MFIIAFIFTVVLFAAAFLATVGLFLKLSQKPKNVGKKSYSFIYLLVIFVANPVFGQRLSGKTAGRSRLPEIDESVNGGSFILHRQTNFRRGNPGQRTRI